MKKNPKAKTIRELFSDKQWQGLKGVDPSIELLAATSWQDPANFTTLSTTVTEITELFPFISGSEAKGSDVNWRDLQKLCWAKYKTFGPLNAAVNSKSDYVAQGFTIYSDVYEIDVFLRDLFFSYRNKLYEKVPGWIIRMLAEGELFILIALDELGTATIRIIEPSRIGSGQSEYGLITDPDDASQTIFYKYYKSKGHEYIPDARFIVDPEYMMEAEKRVKDKIDSREISKLTKGTTKGFKKIGGYRRFILHWKNLTGIHEYLRDTASLSTTLEFINLYIQALKWGLDHKKSLSAYTWGIKFTDTPAGKIAWAIWQKMDDTQKAATNLTKPLTPGSRIFLIPGMELSVYSPQIPSLTGSNQDLLNLSGSGARTPQDLWQGQSEGSTYAAIRTTRPPLVAEIESLQSKSALWVRYSLLRICFEAKLALGGKVIGPGKEKIKLPEVYQEKWIDAVTGGKAKSRIVNRELCEAVKFSFPVVKFEERPGDWANALFGSKHGGLQGIGVSNETLAKTMGVDDLSRERRKKLLEEEEYGKSISGAEKEKEIEKEFTDKGVESGKS